MLFLFYPVAKFFLVIFLLNRGSNMSCAHTWSYVSYGKNRTYKLTQQ